MDNLPKKLLRSRTDRVIAGVCAGLGHYFNIDPIIFRILFVAITIADGVGILIYIILIFVISEEPKEGKTREKGEEFREIGQNIKNGAEKIASEVKINKNWFSNQRNLLGFIIILIGLTLLLRLIWPHYAWFDWNWFWPVVVIAAGILLIIKSNNK